MWSRICCAISVACDFDACAAVGSDTGAVVSTVVRKNGIVSQTAVLCISEALSDERGRSRVFIFERGSAVDAVLSVFESDFEVSGTFCCAVSVDFVADAFAETVSFPPYGCGVVRFSEA